MLLSEKELIFTLCQDAVLYSAYADSYLEFWHSRSKKEKANCTSIFFGRDNFMHLVGINSKTFSAYDFYERCLSGKITIEDCTPTHSVVNRNTRIMLFGALFDFQHSRLYKIGNKDLSTPKNDFDVATGNEHGTIGYSLRYCGGRLLPTTLTNNSISYYCSETDKIIAVLMRKKPTETGTLVFEIAKDVYKNLI